MQLEVDMQNGRAIDRDKVQRAFQTIGDGQYLITFDKLPLKHSDSQRNYFNGVIVDYYKKLWRDVKGNFHKNIVKGMIKSMFLKEEIICEISGEVFEIIRDTRDLSISEYDELIQNARLWYQHETGEEIPKPSYYAKGLKNGKGI